MYVIERFGDMCEEECFDDGQFVGYQQMISKFFFVCSGSPLIVVGRDFYPYIFEYIVIVFGQGKGKVTQYILIPLSYLERFHVG